MDQPILCRKTLAEIEKTLADWRPYSLLAALIHISNGGDSWL